MPISSAYQAPSPPAGGLRGPSLPERWVMRREDVLEMARIVNSLPYTERRLVELRYIHDRPWRAIARELGLSRSEVYRVWDRALTWVAAALGMPIEPGAAQAETMSGHSPD